MRGEGPTKGKTSTSCGPTVSSHIDRVFSQTPHNLEPNQFKPIRALLSELLLPSEMADNSGGFCFCVVACKRQPSGGQSRPCSICRSFGLWPHFSGEGGFTGTAVQARRMPEWLNMKMLCYLDMYIDEGGKYTKLL